MKFQPKRFIVEVKRGTSRATFSSPDAGIDKFSAAEAMLFGAAAKSAATEPEQKVRSAAGAPPRRILESLAEAPAIPVILAEEPVERPRRGRKPGSKNKPKVVAEAAGATPTMLSAAAQAFMRAPLSAKAAPDPAPPTTAPDAIAARPAPSAVRPAGVADLEDGRRGRLRERSNIIQRYVLGTVPQPGQTGSLRARRLARAAAAAR